MFNKAGKFSGAFTKIYNPLITSPTASQIVSSRTPIVSSSAFSKYGTITHASTDWQVASDSQFANIVWQSLTNTTSKTSITTGDLGGGTRYLRVRYKSNTGIYSDWSDAVLFTSPWATGGTGVLVSSTVFELSSSATVTIQSGTYRVSLWGGGGGGASGGGNGARLGGGAGSVYKDVTYSTPSTIPISIGSKGGYGNQNSGGGYGGSPGGGDGGNAGGGIEWTGGGGGGYTSALSMVAAGGGGSGADGGGPGGPGGSGNAAGGAAGGGGNGGSSGSSGGGGGGGSNQGNRPQGGPGGGGSNSGSYSNSYSSPGTIAANRYYSSSSSYYYGDADTNGGAKIEKIAQQYTPVVSITSNLSSTASSTAGSSLSFSITATDTANNDSTVAYQWYVSTDGGSNYSAISGQNAQTLTRYQPFYYSDNGHKIKCRATVTNSVGSNYTDSTVCTLTVARSSYIRTEPTLPSSTNWNSFQDGNDANVGRGDWGGLNTGRTIANIPVGTGKFRIKNNTSLAVRKSNSPSGTNGCTQGRGVRWQAQARISIYRTDGTYAWSQHDRSAQLPVTSDDGTYNWEISLGRWDIDSSIELDPDYAYRAFIEYSIGKYDICNCNGNEGGGNVSDCRGTNNYAGTAYRMYDNGYYAYTPAVYSYETRP